MKISYVRGLEEDGARFWLSRVGWEPSEASRRIAQENDPEKTGYVADIGGGHGRDALWLARQRFQSILIEPNKYSLGLARERAKNERLYVCLINSMLPYLPLCPKTIDVVDLYWTLHQIPDEHKLESLKEIHRVLKNGGTLCSASFGYWESQEMPRNIYPIVEKRSFLNLHVSAGFRPRSKIEKRSDSIRPLEKFWYGIFQKV
ncbi:MAG: class I SAM-dependent methyltransferase [Candidatus Bathyarchaeota archaeon]|nr:class I SAM-dependent methyltransferase [Candidatus Bathyarchaeota archaeon]